MTKLQQVINECENEIGDAFNVLKDFIGGESWNAWFEAPKEFRDRTRRLFSWLLDLRDAFGELSEDLHKAEMED